MGPCDLWPVALPMSTTSLILFSNLSPDCFPFLDLSVVPTTSGSIHPQTVRSSSSSSSHHACTSEINDAPGPSTSCPGPLSESMHTQRPSGSTRTATEGKTGLGMLIKAAIEYFSAFVWRQLEIRKTSFQLLILLKFQDSERICLMF